MPSLMQTIRFQWDLLAGRYQTFLADQPEDIAACVEVLEKVRRKELNRVAGDSPTKVLLFNVGKRKKIATEGERLVMWSNVAKILARRLLDTHRFVVEEDTDE